MAIWNYLLQRDNREVWTMGTIERGSGMRTEISDHKTLQWNVIRAHKIILVSLPTADTSCQDCAILSAPAWGRTPPHPLMDSSPTCHLALGNRATTNSLWNRFYLETGRPLNTQSLQTSTCTSQILPKTHSDNMTIKTHRTWLDLVGSSPRRWRIVVRCTTSWADGM